MTAIKIKDLGKKVMDDYNAAMANPSTEYERGFVDGAQHQMKSSVDKAVNRMAQTEHEPWLLESTQTLAKTLAREFYPEVTQWKCLSDLAGVISQIDNMTTGLMRKPKQEPLTNGEIYTAYITATDQTLRPQDERLAFAFARAIEAAHGIKETEK
jgi:hypothetical protein